MSKIPPKTHITKQKCCNRKGFFSHHSPTPPISTSSVEKTSYSLKSSWRGKSMRNHPTDHTSSLCVVCSNDTFVTWVSTNQNCLRWIETPQLQFRTAAICPRHFSLIYGIILVLTRVLIRQLNLSGPTTRTWLPQQANANTNTSFQHSKNPNQRATLPSIQ